MFFVYDWKFITCLCQPLERFVADLWPAGSSSQQCMWVAGKQWTQPLCLSSTFNPYWKHSFLFLEEKTSLSAQYQSACGRWFSALLSFQSQFKNTARPPLIHPQIATPYFTSIPLFASLISLGFSLFLSHRFLFHFFYPSWVCGWGEIGFSGPNAAFCSKQKLV